MTSPTGRPVHLIGFITHDIAPPISPAPIDRTWMSEMRQGWPHRCLPLLIANQSGWEVRNPCAFTATWMGGDDRMDVMIAPDKRGSGQFLPSSHFGYGILTWHMPILFRTPAGLQSVGPRAGELSEGRRLSVGGHSRNRLGELEFQHELEIHPATYAGAIRGR